jgi:hypothetical protein
VTSVGETTTGALTYDVDVIVTGFFSGTLKKAKLKDSLNKRASDGWKLSRTIAEEKRVFLIFKREAHFLIFERG